MNTMKQNRLVPWFGSDAMMAEQIAAHLDSCSWVGVPFGGGMSVVPHLKARSIVVSDVHRHVINLACEVSLPEARKQLAEMLSELPFHPDVLSDAQKFCSDFERDLLAGKRFAYSPARWALNYFICSWMGRSACAGKSNEFSGKLPVRWSASGGDSNTRFRSAVESIEAWGEAMRRCNFVCQDFREFLGNCKDMPENGIYCDPPWVVDGKDYKHSFTESDHRELAAILSGFTQIRVVIRYGDHPLIREIYPESDWRWVEEVSRTAGNNPKNEVLIVRGAW
jgi:DNA adenine methylase